MNAAVTGGTGFVGRALVQQLVQGGAAVRVLVRRAEDDALVRSMGAEPVRGDLTKAGGCAGFVRGGEVVYHTVARVDLKGRWAEFRKLTIEGTRRLLEASLPAGPTRLVYVSSAGVYSPGRGRVRFSAERTPARPARYNLYGRAKLEAENLVRTECERAGCEWTIVRLGATYGPYKRTLLTHFRPMLEQGRLRLIGKGDNAIAALYVDDAADAIVRAGTRPAAAGRVYDVAGDERITQREWFDATADALEVPRPRRRVPRSVAYVAAAVAEAWGRVRGVDPPFNRAMVALVGADQLIDTGRIREELGWRPRVGFAEGIRRTHEWYLESRGEEIGGGAAGAPADGARLTNPRSAPA